MYVPQIQTLGQLAQRPSAWTIAIEIQFNRTVPPLRVSQHFEEEIMSFHRRV
jgi:hypothetical protein